MEGPVYKPVEVISSYGHLVGDGFASALNKAVNSVFTLTAKMACEIFQAYFSCYYILNVALSHLFCIILSHNFWWAFS